MTLDNQKSKLGDPVPGKVLGAKKGEGRSFEDIVQEANEDPHPDLPEVKDRDKELAIED